MCFQGRYPRGDQQEYVDFHCRAREFRSRWADSKLHHVPSEFRIRCVVSDALWAVDSARVPAFVDVDRGSGMAQLEVVGNLAVRGPNGIILRVNYIVFYVPS
jgi:hypothetical protein